MYGSIFSPLGQRQVLPYIFGLAELGYRMTILTFEPTHADASISLGIRAALFRRLTAAGITWTACPYHPGSALFKKAYDMLLGIARAATLVVRRRVQIIHARSDLPAMLGLILKYGLGPQLLFDIRGLLADEYLDAGHWRADSLTYRLTKVCEGILRCKADGIVVLTEHIRRHLLRTDGLRVDPVVIPCCVDTTEFHPGVSEPGLREELGLANRPILVYSGSVTTWYLPSEMLAFYAKARELRPGLAMLMLTQEPAELLLEQAAKFGIDRHDLVIRKVPASEVPRYLRIADFAVSFIRATFSKQASSPTKIAEYLATGLPICVNRGVGDVDDLVSTYGLGAIVDAFDEDHYRQAWEQLSTIDSSSLRERCRTVAVTKLDLSIAVGRYAAIYEALTGQD